MLSYVMAVEELTKVCGTTGVICPPTPPCVLPIYENGTPEQKAKYLPKLCSGEWLGAFGLTEPGAGTDAQGQQTFAVDEGDHWKLNGSKIFITNAGYADAFIVIAVTDMPDKRGRNRRTSPPSSWSAPTPASQGRQARGQDGHPRFFHLRADL